MSRRPWVVPATFGVLALASCLLMAACGDSLTAPDGDVPAGWRDAAVTVKKGDRLTFSGTGTIDMWPDCEATKVQEGYPQLDCAIVHHMGPEGTSVFPLGLGDYPMPGASVMALVARIGGGPAFLIGRKASVTAAQAGALELTANDPDWRKVDDSGYYRVVVKGPGGSTTAFVR